MEQKLEKKYGLFTAICMVAGTVIGSGVFFKAQVILQKTGGDMPLGIIAWIIGGAIMMACILSFAAMAQKYERVNGLVDYAEALIGPKYGYMIGWFIATIYLPCINMALCWLTSRYLLVFITSVNPDFPMVIPAAEGGCIVGPECLALTLFFMVALYALNALAPYLAGKLQTSATIIKLIPLALMAVVGVIYGLRNGMLTQNFTTPAQVATSGSPLFAAVCATAFAYEGWIIATSINAEIKDSRKNLPRALIIGGIIIILTYVLYYVGVAGGASNQQLIDQGATVAFTNVFGNFLGNILNLFVAISCLGTANGLTLGLSRSMYALGSRGQGPAPKAMAQVDPVTNIPTNSAICGLLATAAWFLYFYLSNLAGTMSSLTVFQGTALESVAFVFDPTELPIITTYALYIPIFLAWMKKETGESTLRRYILPGLAIAGSAFMMLASVFSHRMANFWYLIVFAVIMFIGSKMYRPQNIK